MLRHALLILVLAACGDDGSAPVDASPDSPPDVAPDAAVLCGAPDKLCGTVCTLVAEDEDNCGDCNVICDGGEACDGTCMCPAPFVPATITPSQFDMFQGAMGITVGIGPVISAGTINPFIVGFDAQTAVNTNIDLATVTLGSAPFVVASYRFSLSTQDFDAAYIATAGTLRLTDACGTQVAGTLTNVTFRGVNGGFTNPEIDPDGCTFTVASIAFDIATAPCP